MADLKVQWTGCAIFTTIFLASVLGIGYLFSNNHHLHTRATSGEAQARKDIKISPSVLGNQNSPYIKEGVCQSYLYHDRISCCSNMSLPVLGGIDIVSYQEHNPVWGSQLLESKLRTDFGEYKFYFSSEDNKVKFDGDPWSYTPLFGGFDAIQLSMQDFGSIEAIHTLGPTSDITLASSYNGRTFLYGNQHTKSNVHVRALKKALRSWSQLFEDKNIPFNTACYTVGGEQTGNHIWLDMAPFSSLKLPPLKDLEEDIEQIGSGVSTHGKVRISLIEGVPVADANARPMFSTEDNIFGKGRTVNDVPIARHESFGRAKTGDRKGDDDDIPVTYVKGPDPESKQIIIEKTEKDLDNIVISLDNIPIANPVPHITQKDANLDEKNTVKF